MGDFLWYVKIPKYKIIDKSKAIRNKIWNAKITWGQTVIHKKFGEGRINYVEAEDDDAKVDITFDKIGHKRLMAKYAGLEVLD